MPKPKKRFGNPLKQRALENVERTRKESVKHRALALEIINEWLDISSTFATSSRNNQDAKLPPHINLLLTVKACVSAELYVEGGYSAAIKLAKSISEGDTRTLSHILDPQDRKRAMEQANKLIDSLERLSVLNKALKSGLLHSKPSSTEYQLIGIKVTTK